MKAKKLYAVPFGTDDIAGDSSFYAPGGLTLRASDTFDTLLDRYATEAQGDISDDEQPIGFWIIDQRTKKAADAVWEADPGCDSATYACNRSAKAICRQLAVKTIKAPKGKT